MFRVDHAWTTCPGFAPEARERGRRGREGAARPATASQGNLIVHGSASASRRCPGDIFFGASPAAAGAARRAHHATATARIDGSWMRRLENRNPCHARTRAARPGVSGDRPAVFTRGRRAASPRHPDRFSFCDEAGTGVEATRAVTEAKAGVLRSVLFCWVNYLLEETELS